MDKIAGGVTAAKGFKAAGVRCGIKQKGPDLAVVYSERECSVAGVFTTNAFKAASVLVNLERLPSGKARAVVANAGNANACTGEQGMSDARRICSLTAGLLGVPEEQVYNASTGIIGVLLGAYIITSVDGKVIKPYVNVYLLLMGLYVLSKAFRRIALKTDVESKKVAPLAIFGGFMDTVGGGGWGPIVTTSLVGSGHNPRTTIGSVNFAEFFLTVTSATAFFALLDGEVWKIVAGLVIGGLFAAPFAAYATRHFQTKTLLILVGLLISCVSIYNLSKLF